MAITTDRAERTPFADMADQLYHADDGQNANREAPASSGNNEPGEEDSVRPLSRQEMADRFYPNGSKSNGDAILFDSGVDDKSCYKPESKLDRVARMARNRDPQVHMGPMEYNAKYWPAFGMGMVSLVQNAITGSRDAAGYLSDLAGVSGDEAQAKARDQLGGLVDNTEKGGKVVYGGLKMYLTNPEIRDAVNGAIVKVAPKAIGKFLDELGDMASDPDRTGRAVGRFALSRGISKSPEVAETAKYFLSAMALIGSLDTKDKDLHSKIEGILFGTDYADGHAKQGTR
jgi:hypothetical protein